MSHGHSHGGGGHGHSHGGGGEHKKKDTQDQKTPHLHSPALPHIHKNPSELGIYADRDSGDSEVEADYVAVSIVLISIQVN